MSKYMEWNKKLKIFLSIVVSLVIIGGCSTQDIEPPKIELKPEIVFQIDDKINGEIIIDKALISVSDNTDSLEDINVYLKDNVTIDTNKTSEQRVEICAKDKASNEACTEVNIKVSDSEKKAEEQAQSIANNISNNSGSSSIPNNGATALCNDGTYSYSQNHRGTCSHHSGVWVWYK